MESDAKILLVGSHAILMGSIAARLEYEFHCTVVGLVATPPEAVEMLAEQAADIVLIDADEEGANGDDHVAVLCAACPDVCVILISTTIDDANVARALKAGVRGFLLKNELPTTLAEAVHEVLTGGVHYPPQMKSRIVVGGSEIRLTKRSD